MQKIIIREVQGVLCPVTGKVQLLKRCESCNSFKGFHKSKAKGASIPTAVKCKTDKSERTTWVNEL
jgi:hypothetical protein